MARPGSPAGDPGRNGLCRARPRARPQATPRAKASDDEGVERGAGKGNGEQQSDSLFADHEHDWGFPVLLWVGARAIRGERGENRPGQKHHIHSRAQFSIAQQIKNISAWQSMRGRGGAARDAATSFRGGGGGRVSFAACPAIRTMTGGRAEQGEAGHSCRSAGGRGSRFRSPAPRRLLADRPVERARRPSLEIQGGFRAG